MSRNRKVEIWKDGGWQHIAFNRIKEGDRFRLIEPNGDYIKNKEGGIDLICKVAPYRNLEGELTVEVA